MLGNFLKDDDFVSLMQKNAYSVLQLLISKNVEFGIVVNTKFVDFTPPLSDDLDVKKQPYVLFALAGYTFESLELTQNTLNFHAGFGPNDMESFVSVDLGAITQIQVENTAIFLNFSFYERPSDKSKSSKNIFLNNPKNKEIFKK